MGSRPIDRRFSAIVGGTVAVLALGGFAYLFLAAAPVEEVRTLYRSLRLDAVMELDELYAGGHILTFALITMLLARRAPSALGRLRILVSLAVAGFVLECAQEFFGSRHFNLDDVFANICGILLGFLGLIALGPRSPRQT